MEEKKKGETAERNHSRDIYLAVIEGDESDVGAGLEPSALAFV